MNGGAMAATNVLLGGQGTTIDRVRRGGGGFGGGQGSKGGQGGSGGQAEDDLLRLIRMLNRILNSLDSLVNIEPSVVPQVLHSEFVRNWPDVKTGLTLGIESLRVLHPAFLHDFERAGLAGSMLRMKELSLNYHLDRLDEAVQNYREPPLKAKRSGFVNWIARWLKPSEKTINSVLGSMPKVIPGVEVAKEFKEHLVAAWDIVETAQERRSSHFKI